MRQGTPEEEGDGEVTVNALSISIDGYGAGPRQSLENPLGVGGLALHEWAFATRTFRRMFGQDTSPRPVRRTPCSRAGAAHDCLHALRWIPS